MIMTAHERYLKLLDLYSMKLYGKRFTDLRDGKEMFYLWTIPVVSAAYNAHMEESFEESRDAPDLDEDAEKWAMEHYGKHFAELM